MVLKHLAIAGLVLAVGGCLPRLPVRRLDTPAPVAVAYVADAERGAGVTSVPAGLKARVVEALAKRNLVSAEVPFETLAADFEAARDSKLRYQKVAAAAGGAPFVLLVETKASFFSQISGRYRWTVYARLSAGKAGGDRVVDEFNLPAMLDFDHEHEAEALSMAAPVIAERAGAVFDSFLAARAPAAAPVPVPAPEAAPAP